MTEPRDTKRPKDGGKPGALTSDLAARIARARGERAAEASEADVVQARDMTGLSRGLRLGSEFVAAVLVGAGIGYLLDLWLGTSPWILLVMLIVGFAAGVLNITKTVAAMNQATPPPPGSDLGPGDDDEDR